ncbi:MAG: class I SAM-dependent methyltransferase [Sulfurovum sp.]|uniref:methyltransferase domain-containing protein n=1 Tax=Sulfurovum sp. TaxID=1969726 RepID=UPI003C7172B1
MVDSAVDPLDLYAKVEDLLGVKEAAPDLYAHYLLFLSSVDFETLLDVGCGSGDFLRQIHGALKIPRVKGIDLSPMMVSKTLEQGYDAECINLCDVKGQYDVLTAVFDMLNYLDKEQLKHFFACVREHLNDDGLFLCDINTLYGFENVAVGAYIVDDEERFLTIDSDFENCEYSAEFTLFEKEGITFNKSQETIRQYYHTVGDIVMVSGLELVQSDDVNLYGFDEADKAFLVLKKG